MAGTFGDITTAAALAMGMVPMALMHKRLTDRGINNRHINHPHCCHQAQPPCQAFYRHVFSLINRFDMGILSKS